MGSGSVFTMHISKGLLRDGWDLITAVKRNVGIAQVLHSQCVYTVTREAFELLYFANMGLRQKATSRLHIG